MDKKKTSASSWQQRLFGRTLHRCESVDDVGVATTEVLARVDTIGVYFSFANINLRCDEFVEKLKGLYGRLRAEGQGGVKRLEVVQVVMWANNDVYGDFENGHRESLKGLPWFAVPYCEIEVKTRLSRRYNIKSGVPTLVLLDKEGHTISTSAQERLLEDPTGTTFPWRPRPIDQVLKDVVLQPGGLYQREHPKAHQKNPEITFSDLTDGIRGFYFSANWCPPCRAFTPQLVEAYSLIRKREPGFEIIFVSSDRSAESFATHLEAMPWLAVPWQQAAIRAELAQLYGIRGIPTLLLLDDNGHVITMDGRTELIEDPMAQNFPWKPRSVNILTERFATKLQDYPAIILFIDGEETEVHFAETVLKPAADAYHNNHHRINCDELDDKHLHFLIGLDSETSDVVRDLIGLDDVVPLLVGIDIPNRRFTVMEYGVEITLTSVADFIEKFQSGEARFHDINERMADCGNMVGNC